MDIFTDPTISPLKQLKKTCYWNTYAQSGNLAFFPDCYAFKTNNTFRFRGIIANMRVYRNSQCNAFIGTNKDYYIEIHFDKKCLGYITEELVGLEGYGAIKSIEPLIIECKYTNQLSGF